MLFDFEMLGNSFTVIRRTCDFFVIRELDRKILRAAVFGKCHRSEQSLRVQLNKVISKNRLFTAMATPLELIQLKKKGVIGSRAPHCNLISDKSAFQLFILLQLHELGIEFTLALYKLQTTHAQSPASKSSSLKQRKRKKRCPDTTEDPHPAQKGSIVDTSDRVIINGQRATQKSLVLTQDAFYIASASKKVRKL